MLTIKRSRAWIALEFKPEDCWIGVFWQRRPTRYVAAAIEKECVEDLHVWLCLLPCLPIHLIVGSRYADTRQVVSGKTA